MKKLTKRSLIKKLDRVVSNIVRSKGVCAHCGKGAEQVTLHCAHIFSRTMMSVRFDLNNCIPLCYRCHFWWSHSNPILFAEFIKEYLGNYKYQQLKMKARGIRKWTIQEMCLLLESLQKISA